MIFADEKARLFRRHAILKALCEMLELHVTVEYTRAARPMDAVLHVPGTPAHNLRPRLPFILSVFVGVILRNHLRVL